MTQLEHLYIEGFRGTRPIDLNLGAKLFPDRALCSNKVGQRGGATGALRRDAGLGRG